MKRGGVSGNTSELTTRADITASSFRLFPVVLKMPQNLQYESSFLYRALFALMSVLHAEVLYKIKSQKIKNSATKRKLPLTESIRSMVQQNASSREAFCMSNIYAEFSY